MKKSVNILAFWKILQGANAPEIFFSYLGACPPKAAICAGAGALSKLLTICSGARALHRLQAICEGAQVSLHLQASFRAHVNRPHCRASVRALFLSNSSQPSVRAHRSAHTCTRLPERTKSAALSWIYAGERNISKLQAICVGGQVRKYLQAAVRAHVNRPHCGASVRALFLSNSSQLSVRAHRSAHTCKNLCQPILCRASVGVHRAFQSS